MLKLKLMMLLAFSCLLVTVGLRLDHKAQAHDQAEQGVTPLFLSQTTPIDTKEDGCHATRYIAVENREAREEGCDEKEGRIAARALLVTQNCTGDTSPRCEGKCAPEQTCKVAGYNFSQERHTCNAVKKAGCRDSKGVSCKVSADFACGCSCQ